jgi:hypothetical protein
MLKYNYKSERGVIMSDKTRKAIPRVALLIFLILYFFVLKNEVARYFGIIVVGIIELLTSYFYVKGNDNLDPKKKKAEKFNRNAIIVCIIIIFILALAVV